MEYEGPNIASLPIRNPQRVAQRRTRALAIGMNRKRKGCLTVFAMLIGGIVVLCLAREMIIRRGIHKYDQCDHAALLAACREMLASRTSYTNSPNWRATPLDETSVSLDRDPAGLGPDIPEPIRELNPSYVVIHEDSLVISDPVAFPPLRNGVIAFPANTEFQYGTRQYRDGLWYWNGSLNKSVRREFDRRMEERIERIRGQPKGSRDSVPAAHDP